MFRAKHITLFTAIWIIAVAGNFLFGQCSQTCCKPTNSQVTLTTSGDVAFCYQYTNAGTSCRTCCGNGNVNYGYCTMKNCDPNQVCSGSNTTYQYQQSNFGNAACNITTVGNYNESTGCTMLGSTTFNEMLCTCGPPPTDPKKRVKCQ